MVRKLSVVLLVTAVGIMFVSTAFADKDANLWRNPKPNLKRPNVEGPVIEKPSPTYVVNQTYNAISDGVTNLRVLLGGGRKIIRHDCGGEDPPSLECVFTQDVAAGYAEMYLHDALSQDNGLTWNVAGPLTDPAQEADRDRNHVIDFANSITHLCYTEMEGHPQTGFAYMYWSQDLFQCLQAFNPFEVISDAPPPDSLDEYYTQVVMLDDGSGTAYLSFIDFSDPNGDPYGLYFRKSTDYGVTWGEYQNLLPVLGADGFEMAGTDGPLIMDADGDFIAALVYVNLDDTWEEANGFPGQSLLGEDKVYPAYTQSTDGGDTWDDLRLIFGNDGTAYPQGHTGDPVFDETLHYIAGTQGAAYAAFNNAVDQTAITSDGLVHIAVAMDDTTVGYEGVWHVVVDNGTISHEYVGFPEDPALAGESAVAFIPSIAKADDNHVVIGWTEFIQPGGYGNVAMNAIGGGGLGNATGPVNVTPTPDDITYQRMADVVVPAGADTYYADWAFIYYGEGGSAADSTLWHLQVEYEKPETGIDDDEPAGPGVPRVVSLGQNYPNPFNPQTSISYELNETSKVTLEVMNLRGQLVKTLVNGTREAGTHSVTWDGKNLQGVTVSSGIYFYRLRTDNGFNKTRKMVLLK